MLEHYYSKPQTLDNLRASWLAKPIEQYVEHLENQQFAEITILRRIPVLKSFADFSWSQGSRSFDELPNQIDSFIDQKVSDRHREMSAERACKYRNEVRSPIEQMLSLVLPTFEIRGRQPRHASEPFAGQAPGFFPYLIGERGLANDTLVQYRGWLRKFELYLHRVNLYQLGELSPAVISAFIVCTVPKLSTNSISCFCSIIRVFLRFLYRESIVARDLSVAVEAPQSRRLSSIPRSITWDEVRLMLEVVDRRTVVGIRDYAILLLLVSYGLRAQEVASLTLDNIDWERERILVPERKAGHCTAYPLSTIVGEAIVAYLQNGRPSTEGRAVFYRTRAPYLPLTYIAVGSRSGYYLRKAGINVHRAGSHTLRHTCVQRLIDSEFPLDTIGQYVGHGSPRSTEIYSKVAIETLREVSMGDGESLL